MGDGRETWIASADRQIYTYIYYIYIKPIILLLRQ